MNEQQLLQPYHDACFITHVKKQRRLHRSMEMQLQASFDWSDEERARVQKKLNESKVDLFIHSFNYNTLNIISFPNPFKKV